MSNDRVFSEREVVQVIERAVELQASAPRDDVAHGLTLAELERLGREVGIAPEHLRRAAGEVASGSPSSTRDIDAKAHRVRAERWIPGRLPDAAVEDLFGRMQNRFGPDAWTGWGGRAGGSVERVGRTWTWTHSSAQITVTDEGGGYTLRVFVAEIFSGTRAESVVLSLWTALVGGGLLGGPTGEAYGWIWFVLIMAVACALSFATVPGLVQRKRARSLQRVEALAEDAEQLLLAAAEPSGGAAGRPVPLVSLPDEDEDMPEGAGRAQHGRSAVRG